jgi:ATPase subunit of ABC transporter with duplicated ATPase domains
MFVRLSDVSFSYSDSVAVLREVNLQLGPGWTGVVGPNGAGKTTLLRLITGELAPDSGHVGYDPPGARAVSCPQTVERITAAIESFAAATDGTSRRFHGELKLDPSALARWPTLSPGERRRWQAGAALAAEPAILILDEPTDHLDADARELLVAALRRFGGVGIVVSHDRALLDALTTHTIRVHDTTARIWRGPYAVAKESWEAQEREHHAAYERLKHEHQKLRRRLADKRRLAESAEAEWNAGARKRMKGPRDHDATSMLARGKAEMGSARISRDAGILRRSVDRVQDELREFSFRKQKGRALFVDFVAAPAARILTLDEDEIRAGDAVVLRNVHLAANRTSRIRVAGPNGAGKTTLLRAMLRSSNLPRDRMLYLPQELAPADGIAMLDQLRAMRSDDRARVLTLVAALGVDPDRLLGSRAPSPGEARKLALASGLGRQVWVAILDEPTNHLDMPAIERLEAALMEYPGALVIVTHDEPLARHTAREQWLLRAGSVERTTLGRWADRIVPARGRGVR